VGVLCLRPDRPARDHWTSPLKPTAPPPSVLSCPASIYCVHAQLVAFARDIVDDDEDFDEHLPFMAVEPRSKQKVVGRRGAARRRINEEDALEALYGLRNELEVRRAMCVQSGELRAARFCQAQSAPSGPARQPRVERC
jgi:hypothetical protein